MQRTTLLLGALFLVAVILVVTDAADTPPPPAAPALGTPALPDGHPATGGEPVRAGPLDPSGAPVLPPVDAPAGESLREGPGEGEVLEVIPSASFTILRLDRDGEELWVAGPAVPVDVGQQVAWDSASVVHDFPSATAGRTFAALLFVDRLRVSDGR